MIVSLFTLPTPSNFLTDIGTWSSPFFTELLIYAIAITGILVGGMFASWIIHIVISAFSNLYYRRKADINYRHYHEVMGTDNE